MYSSGNVKLHSDQSLCPLVASAFCNEDNWPRVWLSAVLEHTVHGPPVVGIGGFNEMLSHAL